MSKKYYKVVLNSKGKLFSCIRDTEFFGGNNFKSKYAIEYKVGEWVKPIVSGTDLMCFDSYGDAVDFAYNIGESSRFHIYECKVQNPRKLGLYVDLQSMRLEERISNVAIKRRRKQKVKEFLNSGGYLGTTFCSAIKLTNKIQ